MKLSHVLLGTTAAFTIATIVFLQSNQSPEGDRLQDGPEASAAFQDAVASSIPAGEVLVTEEQAGLEKLAVSSAAPVDSPDTPAPTREQRFESKYSGRSVAELMAARQSIEEQLSKKTQQILKDMIRRGECEVFVQEFGKPIDPKATAGWAVMTQGQGIDSQFEEVKLARLSIVSHPDTADFYAEALWIGGRVDQMGGRTAAASPRYKRTMTQRVRHPASGHAERYALSTSN